MAAADLIAAGSSTAAGAVVEATQAPAATGAFLRGNRSRSGVGCTHGSAVTATGRGWEGRKRRRCRVDCLTAEPDR